MTTTKEQKNNEKTYLKDSEIYALWKYLNGHLTSRPVFQFQDLLAPNTSTLSLWFMLNLLESLGVTLENPVFNKNIYLNFYGKRALKTKELQKICPKGFNVPELKQHFFILKKAGILNFIEFDKKLSSENKEIISKFLNSYTDDFINDRLTLVTSNFLKFENQKQKTLELISDHKTKYGNEFILKYEPVGDEFSPDHDTYLFIHSIIALEKLGNIKVERAWYYNSDVAPDHQTQDFKMKLSVTGSKGIKQKVTKYENVTEGVSEKYDNVTTKKVIKKINHLITRDGQTEDFYYKNKPIKFKGKNTIYFRIFECLCENSDLEGFCSYEKIDEYLIEHGEEECKDRRQMMDRIKNGITNLFRFSDLPKKTLGNKDLIQKTRGEGLILYNP